jgi:sugar lactone lactonase YvrE
VFLFTLACAAGLCAEGTRTWEQSKFEELSKGTTHGIALRSSGGLELAPAVKAITTTPSAFVWSIVADSKGNLYAATGAPARVYLVGDDGKLTNIFEGSELQVQALAVGQDGAIYAATNPDGRVYKIEHHPASQNSKKPDTSGKDSKSTIDPNWSSTVLFEPGTKYIWDLAFDTAGNLFVATGDHGEIFRVTPKGEHSVFFKSDEVHIRALAFDPKGNLIAGSDGSGLVYRISPSGDGFVLYSAPKKEITALTVDPTGNIYVSAAGEKRASAPASFTLPSSSPATTAPTASVSPVTTSPAAGSTSTAVVFPAPGLGAAGGSEIYRIAPDGSPSRLWSSRDEIVYALSFDAQGRLLAGTGNRGHIFAIPGKDEYVDLVKASASQVTKFAPAGKGGLYVSTSNLGKIFVLSASVESEGDYESDVYDAKTFSQWGRVEFRGVGNVTLFARSGNVDNPDRNWSAWHKIDLASDEESGVPAARFIQWKAVLHSGNPAPIVDRVLLNYLPRNVVPEFDDVTVQPATRYQPTSRSSSDASNASTQHFDAPAVGTHDRDSIGVKWTVHDDNDDQMVYSVLYRGDGQTRWLLLKDNLTDKFYSFDASLLPDGGYTIKVLASDAPSHSPGDALTAEKTSAHFDVDTTAPQIQSLAATEEANALHVTFKATDGFSMIKRAEYSLDAGDWKFIEPVGQISDSKAELYDFRIPAEKSNDVHSAAGDVEHVVVVRVFDRFDNMSSAKVVTRAK